MPYDVALVDAVGMVIVLAIAWSSWSWRRRSTPVPAEASVQGALIVVRGGYVPDTIILERGRPARLIFRREESAAASERVVLPAFGKSVALPTGEEVPVEFVPAERGEHPFSSHTGLLSGRIIVE
jgi:plastocyanin domain-containing protein